MALEERRQTIETEQTIGDERVQVLLRAEAIVPGAGREQVTVLLEEARFCMGETDVQPGRVVVDGNAYAQALYRLGEDGAASALQASAPLSRAIDIAGAVPGMNALTTGQVEHVEAGYENGHIVFLITVGLHVRLLQLEKRDVLLALDGETGIEQKTEPLQSVKLSAQSSAQAVVEGDARMPPVLDARTALMDWGCIRIDEAKPDLGGVKVSGSVLAEALVGSGVPGRPVALVKYALPFAQLVDLPEWLLQHTEAEAELSRLSAKLLPAEDGGASLHFDAQVDISVKAMGSDSVDALSDAYGTEKADIVCERQNIVCCTAAQSFLQRETVRANMLLEEGAPSPGTIVALRARPQIAQTEPTAAGTRISGILETQALYLASGSGQLCAAKQDLPFAVECPFALNESDDVLLEVESADASALMNDRLEVSCALRLSGTRRREETFSLVSSAKAVPAEKQPFGVVLYWPSEGEDLWEIGKRYRMSAARIDSLNSAREGSGPLIVRG